MTSHIALHRNAIPLRSIAIGEPGRCAARKRPNEQDVWGQSKSGK